MERPLPVAASLQVFCVKEHEVEEIFELHLLPIDTANCFRTIIALETKFFICEFYMLSISWSKITWVTVFLRRNVVGDWRFDKLCENHLHSQVITFSQLKIGKPWGAIWLVLPHRLSKRQSPTAVLLRTPVSQMIFFNQGMLLLVSNHFLIME